MIDLKRCRCKQKQANRRFPEIKPPLAKQWQYRRVPLRVSQALLLGIGAETLAEVCA